MAKNTKTTTPKEAKTVKVITLVKTAVVLVIIIVAYFAGVITNDNENKAYRNSVRREAIQIVSDLKSQK